MHISAHICEYSRIFAHIAPYLHNSAFAATAGPSLVRILIWTLKIIMIISHRNNLVITWGQSSQEEAAWAPQLTEDLAGSWQKLVMGWQLAYIPRAHDKLAHKQARKPRRYASPILCPLAHLLTVVKCRATSVAKNCLPDTRLWLTDTYNECEIKQNAIDMHCSDRAMNRMASSRIPVICWTLLS